VLQRATRPLAPGMTEAPWSVSARETGPQLIASAAPSGRVRYREDASTQRTGFHDHRSETCSMTPRLAPGVVVFLGPNVDQVLRGDVVPAQEIDESLAGRPLSAQQVLLSLS
jgi:hypothetical protein